MAYRRSLSTRVTLLAGSLNSSFTYISHHDSDRTKHGEFHSSGSKIDSHLSYSNNTSCQFTGTFCQKGYGLVGNGLLLNRYMSTSIGETDKTSFSNDVAPVVTDDVAGVITDASAAMEVVASQAPDMNVDTIADPELGLFELPGYIIQHLIHGVHSFTGLNWWASIALTTLLVRGLTIPFLVYELKVASKFEGMKPQALEEGNKKMDELCKEYGVNRNDPDAEKGGLLVEGSLVLSFLIATLRMVRDFPSLKTGGALWFIDLTTPDVTTVLPCLMMLTFWGMVMFIWNDRQGRKAALLMHLVVVAGILPKATLLCFLTSDVFSLCFGYVLRGPAAPHPLLVTNSAECSITSGDDKMTFYSD